jgi:hypothetical protein
MLLRADQPRFQMGVIVLTAGAFGFLTSYVFLHLGLRSMTIRYPLAVGVAYLMFLGMLRLWLAYQGRRLEDRTGFSDIIDLPGFGGGPSMPEPFVGAGGSFGGAGASASFEEVATVGSVESSASLSEAASSASHGLSLDLDELWLIVLALLVLISGAVLACYAIYIAPALFAEILVDGVLIAGLYHRLRAQDMQHWLKAAVKRTWLPVMGTAMVLAISGFLMQKLVPEARSIAELFR